MTVRNTAADAPEDSFPADSYSEAAKHLRRPFTPAAVKFKVQATWPKNAPTSGLIVPYIDARLVIERLNLVCPEAWEDRYERDGSLLWCVLTVFGLTRRDVGDDYTGKGLVSDALKRAAVKFGVGVSLYATQKIVLAKADGHLKDAKSAKGPTLTLTAAGEKRCRGLYGNWLAETGEPQFGRPLDHGDVEDALGDTEADAPHEARTQASAADAPERELARLLAYADEHAEQRAKIDQGMRHLGARADVRIRELTTAQQHADGPGAGLADLAARVNRALDTRSAA